MRRALAAMTALGLLGAGAWWRLRPSPAAVRRTVRQGGERASDLAAGPLSRLRRPHPVSAKEALEDYLRRSGVSYQLQHHALAYTAKDVAAAEHVSDETVAKVVMVLADGTPAMLVLPASERINLDALPSVLGAGEVRLANEEEFAHLFPGSEIGAMPPFGNRYGVPVYVDRILSRQPTIICPAGTHTDTVAISFDDYTRLASPTIAAFSERETGGGS